MTIETAKRLYVHYVSQGMKTEAENLLKKRPELEAKETQKTKKSK